MDFKNKKVVKRNFEKYLILLISYLMNTINYNETSNIYVKTSLKLLEIPFTRIFNTRIKLK